MSKPDLKTVGIEVAKTVGGFIGARAISVQANKMLKVDQETDPKKKKLKEVGIGLAIAGAGTYGAYKLPEEYQSIAAGMAAGGAVVALSPYGKENKGFIPVLNGPNGSAVPVDDYTDYEPEYDEFDQLQEHPDQDDEDDDYDYEEVNDVASEVGNLVQEVG